MLWIRFWVGTYSWSLLLDHEAWLSDQSVDLRSFVSLDAQKGNIIVTLKNPAACVAERWRVPAHYYFCHFFGKRFPMFGFLAEWFVFGLTGCPYFVVGSS